MENIIPVKKKSFVNFGIFSILVLLVTLSYMGDKEAEAIPAFQFEFGSVGSGPGQFFSPLGVATDSNDRIIVADTNSDRIQVFDSAGALVGTFGSFGAGPGQFSTPIGVATDSNDRIIVADANNDRIQVFDSAGVFQFQLVGFSFPKGVATDSNDRIIVTDVGNNQVRVFNSAGVPLLTFGSFGAGPGQFNAPQGVATDSTDRIIVSDLLNARIQVFNSAGAPLFQFGSLGAAPGQFSNPQGVTTDSNDRIIVADANNFRIQVFNSVGAPQFQFGSVGAAPGQFINPQGVTTDSNDRIIVTDAFNSRIQVFAEPVCGNGIIEGGEACDAGGANGTICGCNDSCQFPEIGTTCGESSSGVCDNADTCDGAGACQDNIEPTDTTCGDDDAACVNQDFCGDGTGLCEDNGFKSAGTACGDDTSGVCDNADTCNDSGVCQDNFEPTDTVCRPDTGVCDVADFCDGAGTCDPNAFEPAGTACACDAGAGQCNANNQCVANISIDIKPGSDPNSINPKNNGLVPVAILGSDTFDVFEVDVGTLSFTPGKAAPAHDDGGVTDGHYEDVNDDGIIDLVTHYVQKETGIVKGDVMACITGETEDGQLFKGCDAIKTPKNKNKP